MVARAHAPPVVPLLGVAAMLGALAAYAPEAAFAAGAVAALVAVMLVWPESATLLVLVAVWVNVPGIAVTVHGVPPGAAALFPLPLLVPLAYAWMRGRPLVVNRTFLLLVLLLVVEVVSMLLAANQDVAAGKVRELAVEGAVLYLLVLNAVREPETLRRAVWTLVAAGSWLALISLHQQLTGAYERPYGGWGQVDSAFFRGQTDVPRLAGPLGDPNYYAQILLPILPLALLGLWRERSPRLRLAAAASAGLICFAITLTYSRGAAVAFLAVLAGLALLRYLRLRQLLALAAGVALLLAVNPGYRDRVETISSVGGATARAGDATRTDESTRSRTTEMLAAGLAFLDHPVLGVGPGGFPHYYQEYAPRVGIEVRETTGSGAQKGEAAQREAHDVLLGVAAETGVLGVALFLAIVGVTFADLRRARRRWVGVRPDLVNLADSLTLALVAYLVAGLFLTLAFERYFWLLVALAGAAGALARSPRTLRAGAP
jgi:putative inorganic carbon (HCO3(-)) transporter